LSSSTDDNHPVIESLHYKLVCFWKTDRAEHGSWSCRRLVAHNTTSVLSASQFSDSGL